ARALERADADREVEPFMGKIEHLVRHDHMNIERRVAGQEPRQQRRDVEPAERRRHRNAESTGDLASGPLEAARERVEILEQRTSLLEQRRAFLGELEPARRAVEEPHAEPLLEAL